MLQRTRDLDARKASEREAQMALEGIEKDLLDTRQTLAARERTERQLLESASKAYNQRCSARNSACSPGDSR